MKKKPKVTKLLTGEKIKGLEKKKSNPKYAYGDLFKEVDNHMRTNLPLKFGDGGVSNKISKLMSEGYNQDQAVAIALSMEDKNKLKEGGKKKYQDGDEILLDEQVVEGSARHKELIEKEKQYQAYLDSKEAYRPMIEQFGAPKEMSVEQFNKRYPGNEDFIPEGTTTVFGFHADPREGGFSSSPSAPIYAETVAGGSERAWNFFPGYTNPGQPGAYDLVPAEEVDMSIEEEPLYESPPKEPKKSTVYMKARPGAWYKDASGKNVMAPKDAVWQEDTGTYYDPKSGTVYNPRKGTATVDPTYDPTKGVVEPQKDGGLIKYFNGGDKGETIQMDEQVTPGSERHKELQKMESSRQKYLDQQEYLQGLGVDLKNVPMSKITGSTEFDAGMVPTGAETAYQIPTDTEGWNLTDSELGIQIFSSPRTNREYLTGLSDPGEVPAYDLMPEEEIDMSIEEEPLYKEPTVVEEPKRSSVYMKARPGAWYKDASGKNVMAPKDAVWQEDTGTYYDPKTGTVFNPRKGTAVTSPTYDPTKGAVETTTVEESGVPNMQDGGAYRSAYYQTLGEGMRKAFGDNAFKDGGEAPVEELLTEEKVTELEENKNVKANAEVEHGEYIKFPDGTTQRADGEKHSNGGIDMHLPDGTRILSNHRKLNAKQAKKLRDEYGIKVNTKHTYSQALDAYVNKIGLRRLYDDQEQLFEELEKVTKNSMSEGSSRINKEYLSKKIHGIEKQKEDKEKLKTDLFDSLFTMQEVGKRGDEEKEVEDFFKEGGISREAFRKVANRYGLSEKEGIELYKGNIPDRLKSNYRNGGEEGIDPNKKQPKTLEEVQQMYKDGELTLDEANYWEVELANIAAAPPVKFTTTTGEHEFSNKDVYVREEQHAGDAAFGNITKESLPIVLNNLYRNFPDIVAEEYGVVYNDDGTIGFDDTIDFTTASDKVKHFQERANKRMTDTANMIISNPDSFSPEYVQSAQDYLTNETFDESLARGIDSKLGNFTSGRYSLGIDVVTPEEKANLETKGIFTTNQLQNAIDSGDVTLSEGSLNRLEKIRTLTPEGADVDFTLNTIEPVAPVEEPTVEEPIEQPDPEEGITDDIIVPGKQYPKLFMGPDQSPLPPSAMEAHLMNSIRLQRIDPVRIGVETELQQASDAVKEGVSALDHLPPNQRAAAIVGLQANVQKGINEAIHKANVTNAQNQSSAELFNIGQAGQEEQLRANNLLSFESRQLTAKAKTEEEVRNYYDQLNRIALNNFRNQQDLNMLQTMAPDYSISSTGMGIDYTPEGEFKIQDRSKLKGVFKDGGKYKDLFG